MWSKGGVVWIKMQSNRIKMRSKGDQNAEQRGSMCGAKWIKMRIKMRSKVEQNMIHDIRYLNSDVPAPA